MLEISHIERQSETALSVYFGEANYAELAMEIALLAEDLRGGIEGLVEVIPCSRSLFIEFHILETTYDEVVNMIGERVLKFNSGEVALKEWSEELLELPVYYHPEVAPDLVWLAKEKGMSVDEVILIHSQTSYRVSSLGFAPGFAYLSGMDERLAIPRHDSPRQVAKGSLGIADLQTAIYPQASPGGWVIIGNCPVTSFDVDTDPMTPFKVGMEVRFKPITREEFLEIGGKF
jgi:inhibitor of KinA